MKEYMQKRRADAEFRKQNENSLQRRYNNIKKNSTTKKTRMTNP